MLSLSLDEETELRLEHLSASSDESKAELATRALLLGLADLEDVQIAEERLTNPGRIWTQDELERGLDLEG